MKIVEMPVSEEIITTSGSEEAVRWEAHEALLLDLVRRGKISKGKAAELLGVSLWDLPGLIARCPGLCKLTWDNEISAV
jgi:predicted HTH domain antitoxin